MTVPAAAASQPPAASHRDTVPLRRTWPIGRVQALQLLATYLGLTALFSAIGWSITDGPLRRSAVVRTDERVEDWPIPRRTPAWNTASWWGSMLAETVTKIVVTLIVCALLVWLYRRWIDAAVVAVSLIVEAAIFITVTYIVGRPRPDVPALDGSPVESSFPSGHTAAAVVYSAMVIVLFWHTRRRIVRALAVLGAVLVPVIVGAARMYRGMHHLSDVVAGMALGAVTVWLVLRILAPHGPEHASAG